MRTTKIYKPCILNFYNLTRGGSSGNTCTGLKVSAPRAFLKTTPVKELGKNIETKVIGKTGPDNCPTNDIMEIENDDVKLIHGDCLERMKEIHDKSIDMILCDLPYGTTACKWDNIIPFEPLWEQYERIIKDNGAIVLFGSEPFSSKLRMSNLKNYRYDWIWIKNNSTGFQLANKMPLKKHENISVFYKKLPTYNPQGLKPYGKINKRGKVGNGGHLANECNEYIQQFTNYPTQILEFPHDKEKLHPTQKPVALLEYLIKTYTTEGMTILDNCMGSGSTGVACVNTNRKFIGIELDEKYYDISCERIRNSINEKTQNLFKNKNFIL